MLKVKVIGKVWSSKKIDALPTGALLEVEEESGEKLIAFDPIGCADNEFVLIVQGSVAANYFTQKTVTIDALIIGVIDDI